MKSLLSNQKGFTLVELLIVVAIIGVLSTIGIPTFRSMVQKAKKSEAKVALGGLYTAEAAFFAEYGGYGNQLDHVGFDLEGSGRIYSVGFPGNATCGNAAAALPDANSGPGRVIRNVINGYVDGGVTVREAAANSTCWNDGAVVSNTGSTFVATATGVISAAGDLSVANSDIWRMDEQRRLFNCQDGVGRSGAEGAAACPSPDEAVAPN